MYLGSFNTGTTVYLGFTTHAKTGAAVAPLTGYENSDIKIYKNGSATERASASGVTMTSPFDSITGLHLIAMDLSDNADAGFYAAGAEYMVVLNADTETVDGLSVVRVLGYFSIERVVKVNATQFAGQTITAAAGVTLPAAVASPTNITAATGVVLSAAGVQAIWDALSSALTTVGSIGKRLVDDLTGDIYARLGAPAGASISADMAAVKAVLPAALTSGGRMKASVEAILDTAFTEGASGRIAAAFKQFFNIATPAATMDHGILTDTVTTLTNAPSDSSGTTTLLSRLSAARAGYLDNLSAGAVALEASLQGLITTIGASAAGVATAVWASATRTLSAAGVQAIWDAATSALTTAGSIGKWILDKLDVVVSTRLATSGYTAPLDAAGTRSAVGLASANLDTQLAEIEGETDDITAIKAKTDSLTFTVTNQVDSNVLDWKSATAPAMTGDAFARLGAPAGASVSADVAAVKSDTGTAATSLSTLLARLSALRAGYLDNLSAGAVALEASLQGLITTVGVAGAGLTAADDAVLAAIAALNNLSQANVRTAVGLASANLDTQLSAIAAYIDTEVAAIKAKTDNLPASPAAAGDAMALTSSERNAVADAFLNRDLSTGTDSGSTSVRTVRQALRFLRNKFTISGGTLTVFKEDDATTSHTGAVGTTSGDPVTSIDPAGP